MSVADAAVFRFAVHVDYGLRIARIACMYG